MEWSPSCSISLYDVWITQDHKHPMEAHWASLVMRQTPFGLYLELYSSLLSRACKGYALVTE